MARKPTPRKERRPGGRSSRIRAAVFSAAEELLTQHPGALPSMGDIAARAEVNATSLYRRWGDVRALLAAVAVERLMRDNPLPDSGVLRNDLIGWATGVVSSLGTRRDVLLLRVLTAYAPPRAPRDLHELPISPRIRQLEEVLERAAARGEPTPSILDVMELILGPIYLRALFVGPIDDAGDVERLVDRALALAVVRC